MTFQIWLSEGDSVPVHWKAVAGARRARAHGPLSDVGGHSSWLRDAKSSQVSESECSDWGRDRPSTGCSSNVKESLAGTVSATTLTLYVVRKGYGSFTRGYDAVLGAVMTSILSTADNKRRSIWDQCQFDLFQIAGFRSLYHFGGLQTTLSTDSGQTFIIVYLSLLN